MIRIDGGYFSKTKGNGVFFTFHKRRKRLFLNDRTEKDSFIPAISGRKKIGILTVVSRACIVLRK